MQKLSQITAYRGVTPDKATQDPISFSEAVGTFLKWISSIFTPSLNNVVEDINTLSTEINTAVISMEGYANYRGDWDTATTYAQGESVSVGSLSYVSKVAENVGFAPADYPAKWLQRDISLTELSDDTSPQLSGNIDARGYAVTNYSIESSTGISLDLSQATMLIANLSESSAISFTNIPAGASIWVVELSANGYTPSWDATVVWDGDGEEPEWSAGKDLVQFYTTDGGTHILGMRVREGA